MSGFVYVWRDRKHRRYYVGSHWGTADDGYVCSSPWMLQAYKRRPQDFKRRIVAWVSESRDALLDEEQRWLDMIDPEQKRGRYYNLTLKSGKRWHTVESSRLTVGQKISKSHRGRKQSKESNEKRSASMMGKLKGRNNPKVAEALRGRKSSPDAVEKMKNSKTGAKRVYRPDGSYFYERKRP